jgi:hypothetical protein
MSSAKKPRMECFTLHNFWKELYRIVTFIKPSDCRVSRGFRNRKRRLKFAISLPGDLEITVDGRLGTRELIARSISIIMMIQISKNLWGVN